MVFSGSSREISPQHFSPLGSSPSPCVMYYNYYPCVTYYGGIYVYPKHVVEEADTHGLVSTG